MMTSRRFEVEIEVNLRPPVCLPVCLGVGLLSGTWNLWSDLSFLSDNCGFLDVVRPLWREGRSVIYSYNCFWDLPEQLLSGFKSRRARDHISLSHLRPPPRNGSCPYITWRRARSYALVVTAYVLLDDIVERSTRRYLGTKVLNLWEVSMGGSHSPIQNCWNRISDTKFKLFVPSPVTVPRKTIAHSFLGLAD
jgi:hypothetical protein